MKTVIDVLIEELEVARQIQIDVVVGGVGDHSKYQNHVGVIRGLTSAVERAKQLRAKQGDDDDE